MTYASRVQNAKGKNNKILKKIKIHWQTKM